MTAQFAQVQLILSQKWLYYRTALICAGLGIASLCAAWWALTSGSFPVTTLEIFEVLLGRGEGMAANVIRELRLPRVVAAFSGGGLLAVAGALMQVMLRNPLAEPYVLGVSGGAAVGALSAMLLGLATFWVDISAFVGAVSAIALVFSVARGDGSWTETRLLLTGIVVAAGCGAVVTLLLTFAPDTRVHSMLFWLMGDISGATRPWSGLVVLVVALALLMPFSRDLNMLTRGELTAAALGVNTLFVRLGLYLVAALLTATAVTMIGTVGFVGLIVPHLVRLTIGNDQRVLLPVAAFSGGLLLLVADTAARTFFAPVQLPVGVFTALTGVPVFLFLLSRHRA